MGFEVRRIRAEKDDNFMRSTSVGTENCALYIGEAQVDGLHVKASGVGKPPAFTQVSQAEAQRIVSGQISVRRIELE